MVEAVTRCFSPPGLADESHGLFSFIKAGRDEIEAEN